MSKLRIGIDISQIVYEKGVSVYTRYLVENLLIIDQDNEYVLFGGALRKLSTINDQLSTMNGSFQKSLFPIPPTLASILWNKLHILPIETFTGRLDVFHSSDWTQPPSSAYKVTTIHDLVPLLYPESTKKDAVRDIVKTHLSRLFWVKEEIDKIIAVSNATKADIINHLKIPESKIEVVYEAARPSFYVRSNEEVRSVMAKFGINSDYLLAVGTDPRKNLERVIKACEQLKPKHAVKLVVAGYGNIPDARGIIHISSFLQDDLACLYTGAQVLVYPSLYEGFGLPILEAFSCGCPVVTSNISSMPEVAGDAAVLVNPKEVAEIADGIKIAFKDRERLSKRGLMRAKDFSWEKCAKETLNIYQNLNK